MLGIILFENAEKVHWKTMKEAIPVFFITCLVPYSYSILVGICYGTVFYVPLYLCTTDVETMRADISKSFAQVFPHRVENHQIDETSLLLPDGKCDVAQDDGSSVVSTLRTIFSTTAYSNQKMNHTL